MNVIFNANKTYTHVIADFDMILKLPVGRCQPDLA